MMTTHELARTATASRLERAYALTPMQALAILEDGGYITPRCPECAYLYKDAINVAATLSANPRWRPPTSHAAHPACVREARPHCPCGPCTGTVAR